MIATTAVAKLNHRTTVGDISNECLCYLFQGFTDVQLQLVEDNTSLVEHREKEITQIVRSINDLNEIFKDLATMIVDQVKLIKLFSEQYR